MKKTKTFVASIVLAAMISSSVSAALPYGAVIIGDKAYDINYIAKNASRLNDILNNSTNFKDIYYVDTSDTVKSLFSGTTVSDLTKLEVSSITYYDLNGNKKVYAFDTNSKNFNEDATSSTVEAEITVTSLGSGGIKFVRVRIPETSRINVKPYNLDAKYFKVYNNNNSDLIKKVGKPESSTGESEDAYVINMTTTDPYIRLQLLSSDKMPIATTESKQLPLVDGKHTVTFKLDNYFKPPTDNNFTNVNGLGNLNNNGLTIQNGEWTYYSNSADGGGIYRSNGIVDEKICNDNAKYLNILGDYIYYSNYSDGQKIYKIRKDGTGRRIVCTDQASYVAVSGEYIYYSYHSGTGVGNIKKVNRNANKSVGTAITSDEAEYLVVDKDVIYYVNKYQGNTIYSVHTDGTYRSKISKDSAKFITLVGDKIYYVTDSGQLKWISKNGGSFGTINVSNGSTGKDAVISAMNITDDGKYMYYSDASDGNKIYRAPLVDYLRISGDKYSDDYTNFINIVGDKIYYTKGSSMLIANEPKISPNKDSYGRSIYIYSSTPVAKPKQSLKIISYDKIAVPTKNAVGADLSNLEEYLPDKVTAVMSDNSVRELLVNWNLNSGSKNNGAVINYTGTIVGYGTKVALTLSMASESIPAASVEVINNAGLLDDKVFVGVGEKGNILANANLQAGDVIRVYRDPYKAELLGQDIVLPPLSSGRPLSATIILRRNKTITDDARYVYVTRTSPNTNESEVVPVEITREIGGRPTFDKNNLSINVINYGTLENGLTENDIVEIAPTTQLQQGDIVHVYKEVEGNRIKIGSQMVEIEPDPNPFNPKKYKVSIILPAGSIEYDASKPLSNKIFLTRSNQFAESDAIEVAIPKGIPLTLGNLTILGAGIDAVVYNLPMIPNEAYNDTQYQYYYMIGGSMPDLGAGVDGWTLIGNQSDPRISGVTNGTTVYVVQTYNKQILKCSKTIAQMQ
ncbi:hypothetical protein GCM10008905_23840 [Clostridium malenominatum]|uniref:DUF5050 domain-containing protein n=1 Tax=Clostridium malenominatum TaxID=1539 RepID=A0ABP3U8C9_9CLOT